MSVERRTITTDGAPAAIGPYSQAVRHGQLLFCSGVIPVSDDGSVVGDDCAFQVNHCLDSLAQIATTAGTDLKNALRLTIYTTKLERFAEINAAYAEWFDDEPPARVTVGVAALPRQVDIEVEATIAVPT